MEELTWARFLKQVSSNVEKCEAVCWHNSYYRSGKTGEMKCMLPSINIGIQRQCKNFHDYQIGAKEARNRQRTRSKEERGRRSRMFRFMGR
tara:strand:- start:210 stop:482 length:273 start_codon:yes stop_codon:yes gene_type:complete